jgi:hypothetical protein
MAYRTLQCRLPFRFRWLVPVTCRQTSEDAVLAETPGLGSPGQLGINYGRRRAHAQHRDDLIRSNLPTADRLLRP